jgi:protein phosphatase 1 regulatory subunit 7
VPRPPPRAPPNPPPQVLDVSNNRLTAVENLAPLTALEDLWLNDNAIPSLDGLGAALAAQRGSLTTVYLSGNPAAADPGYRETLLALLPKLAQLDDKVLPPREP